MKTVTLYSLQTERYALASLLKFQEIFPEIDSFVIEEDFYNEVHQIIFRVLKICLESREKINNVLLSAKVQNIGISKFGDLDITDYIDSISKTSVKKEDSKSYFKTLIGYRIRRNIRDLGAKIAEHAQSPELDTPDKLITQIDKIYSESIKKSIEVNSHKTTNIFESIEQNIENIASNPPDVNKYPMGPFPTINNLLGSLHRPSNITLYAARTKQGKSQLLFFINCWMAEKYGWPVYWQDSGEMTIEEMQNRAISCLSGGEVPLHAVEQGTWAKHPEWSKIVKSLWPRVKKIKFYHEDISDKKPNEIISAVRRFSYNVVGRDNTFLWCLDYLKPFSDTGGDSEWRQFGTFCKDIKSFINNEILVNLQTAIQNNRKGISGSRNTNEMDSEDAISQDRATQQVSHGLILRKKNQDEIEEETFDFGNMKLSWPITRHLGKQYERAEKYVKDLNGFYRPNCMNLRRNNFFFEDLGDFQDMIHSLEEKHNIQKEDGADDGKI